MKTIAIHESQWLSALRRDASADGKFVFAVRSTGIYCRPSCPARRPKRANVEFFPTPESAELHHYRACRRCHPREQAVADATVACVCRLIEANLEDGMNLSALAEKVGLSPFYLQRKFKKILGLSPREYADICRFRDFKRQIKSGPSITAAVYSAGYGSSSRAYERTAIRLGMTPTHYRQGAPQTIIYYTTAKCALGRLLMAATDKGICTVSLGATKTVLVDELRKEFASAGIKRGPQLRHWIGKVLKHLDGDRQRLDLPLDIRATAFQARVWMALQKIPYGQTRSYSQIADAIGAPKAIRAVARACATNQAALIIPCHRAVRATGALAGYRWGVDRKRMLLAKESAVSKSSRRRSPDRHDKKRPPGPA